MRCVVNENFKVFHGHSPVKLEAGQVVSGSLAELLLKTAPRKVTEMSDGPPAADVSGQKPEHREPCVDGSVCGGPHCPPEPDAQTGGDDSKVPDPPQAPEALDIDAPIADVLAWVGTDAERAVQALELEQAKASPRSTLVKQLEKTAASGA